MVTTIAKVDGKLVSPDVLWWPGMNFNQFRWDAPIGDYELELSRTAFVEQLESVYLKCSAELQADDVFDPDYESPLKDIDYPPLEKVVDTPAALFELVGVFLYENVFEAFLPFHSGAARFMINSVDAVSASPSVVVICGRGYHDAPGFGVRA